MLFRSKLCEARPSIFLKISILVKLYLRTAHVWKAGKPLSRRYPIKAFPSFGQLASIMQRPLPDHKRSSFFSQGYRATSILMIKFSTVLFRLLCLIHAKVTVLFEANQNFFADHRPFILAQFVPEISPRLAFE